MADSFKQYDEDQAVEFIRKMLPAEVSEKYTDDEILMVIDIMWDYYEDKGFTTLPSADDDEADDTLEIKDIVNYVKQELKKDSEFVMDPEDLPFIIKGELEYEETLDIFGD